MSGFLSPFVYWAQSKTNIFIKIDLKDAKNIAIKLDQRRLDFQSNGVGAQGLQNYGFSLDFYSDIDKDESNWKVQDSKIDFNLVKLKNEWWPRVTSKPQKPVWLKIDFDRWQSEDDLDSENEKVRDIREDYADLYKQLQKEEFGYIKENIKKVYLIIYNLLMFVGFTYVVSVMCIRYLKDGTDSFPGTYEAVGNVIGYLHLLQFSEIFLTLIGWRSGGIFTPLVQIGGRLCIIFLMIGPEPKLQVQPVISYLYFIWSLVEIIRYPFYVTQVLKIEYYFLTWLRYSVWIILYPLGFSAEATVMYKSIPYLEESSRFQVSLPNSINFTFAPAALIRIYLLYLLMPTAYILMSHMYYARKKKLRTRHMKVE